MTDDTRHSIRSLGAPGPRGLPPRTPVAPLEPPRGRLISARSIINRYYLDADSGEPLVTERWIRDNMPYKQDLSHSRVAWYDTDVAEIVEIARAKGIKIKHVKLTHLEKAG